MSDRILERDGELEVLAAALAEAEAGRGQVVLVSGEAGIGKTRLLRAFVHAAGGRARVLQGACDDLVTPRTLGPLRDAVAGTSGPLASALAAGNRDEVMTAVLAEVARTRPTVLIVEDVHWADDATLDVLRYLSRRVVDQAAVLLVSYRDDEIGREHPAQRLLGALGGDRVHRLALQRLSRSGVAQLAGGTAATSASLFALTAGNPFFVSEVLATAGDSVPGTVVDAVLARVRRLEPRTQAALEQLAVVPSRVELPLARALLGDLTVLAEAERRGVLEVQPAAVGFRHELARHAVEDSLSNSERMQLNGRVLDALLTRPEPDLPRVVHHAVQAGDDATVVTYAPEAARQAAAVAAHAQEIGYYEQLLDRRYMLGAADEAAVQQALSLSFFTVGRMEDALQAGLAAVRLREELGQVSELGDALVALGPAYWTLARNREALDAADRSVELLRPGGDSASLAYALLYQGLLQSAIGHLDPLRGVAEEAHATAVRISIPDLVAMSRTLVGRARLLTGELAGIADMDAGLRASIAAGNHTFAMMGFVLLVQDLWDLGRYEESERYLTEARAYARQRELDFYVEHLNAYRFRLCALRGDWSAAEAGLRELVGTREAGERGSTRYTLPILARLLVRTGADDAETYVDWARDFGRRANCTYDLLTAGFVDVEYAWTADRPELAVDAVKQMMPRMRFADSAFQRGELARWVTRLGEPAEIPADCPEVFAAGLRGDWAAAAAMWERIGAPYERALELADSGKVEPTLEALRILTDLGARPAAAHVRRRLRDLGLSQLPRGPQPTTRANPAGLTERQVEILQLLAAGRTNAEIAAELVVSVRTVDHHVSAVLQKLGMTNRRQAAKAAAELGL